MSARKMRLVIDQIRDADVNDAYSILQFSKKAAAEPIDKALRSAVANAVDKADQQGEVLDVDDLEHLDLLATEVLPAARELTGP